MDTSHTQNSIKRYSKRKGILVSTLLSALPILIMIGGHSFLSIPLQLASAQPANGTGSTVAGLDCNSISSQLGGNMLPNPSGKVCDVAVFRQAPQITGPNGTILSNLLVSNHLFEFMPLSNASSTNNDNNTVMVAAEFALQEQELPLILKSLNDSKWNIIAIHNHLLLEKPDMIFVHTTKQGDLNTLQGQASNILSQIEASAGK